MDKIFDFLCENRDVAFATVENGKPHIRVFQIMMIEETKIYFATSSNKEVWRQLMANPYVEILGMKGDISVRVWGVFRQETDITVQRKIFEANCILKELYSDYSAMVYGWLEIEGADFYDLSFRPPLLEHFNL